MKPKTTMPHVEDAALVIATPLEDLAATDTSHDIRLESCSGLEWIVVRTRNSTYEMIVPSGDTGDVMVRGGEFFNEFRQATVAGSILGRTAVKPRTICIGCHLELHTDGSPLLEIGPCRAAELASVNEPPHEARGSRRWRKPRASRPGNPRRRKNGPSRRGAGQAPRGPAMSARPRRARATGQR
jgi:hypothetical protein